MKRVFTRKKKTAGYTLIEMLVVVTIIGIIFPVAFASIASLYQTHAQTFSKSLAVVEAATAVKETVRDIRSAVYSETGSLPLVEMGTSTMTLFSDTDFDGDVERVRYFLDGNTLRKGTIEPSATSSYPASTETFNTLIKSTANLDNNVALFRYYNATSTEITSSANSLDVRRIEVQYIASVRFRNSDSEVTMMSSATIRNLKDTY